MFRSASTVLAGMCFLMFGLCSAPKTKEVSRQIKIQEEEVKVDLLYFGATWCPPCNQMKKLFKDKEIKKDFPLPSGSLIHMTSEVQDIWQHCIPKSNTDKGRMSLTFRLLK